MMIATGSPLRLPRTPLRHLHKRVRKELGQRVDWLRIYIVNEEEILLAGTCSSAPLRQRVGNIVRDAAPGARLRNAIVVGELQPGLRVGTPPAVQVGRNKR